MTALPDHIVSNVNGDDKHTKNNSDIHAFRDINKKTIQNHELISKASTFNRSVPVLSWLDTLEKDFDKAFVDLDLLLGDFDSDQVIYMYI